jgi:hypothetical protein
LDDVLNFIFGVLDIDYLDSYSLASAFINPEKS